MDVQGMASLSEWVAARQALMQDLARLRDQFASGVSTGSRRLAPLLSLGGGPEDGWNDCLNRLEAFLVFARTPRFEPERWMS
jgi:hypothetical protein